MKTFENYIGQVEARTDAQEVCDALVEGRRIPLKPRCFTGPAGLGKTKFAKFFSHELTRVTAKDWTFVEINSATTLPDFIGIWANHIEGKKAVIFLDEAHALSKKVANFLKPILETQGNVEVVSYGDHRLTSNPYEHLWLAATNCDGGDEALFGATGRFRKVPFVKYTHEEVKGIMRQWADKWAKQFKVHNDAIEYLATRCLPNGRAIDDIMNICLQHGGLIDIKVAKSVCVHKGFYPMGLRQADIDTLVYLGKDSNGRQVNEIAAASGESDSKMTGYRLQWLAGYGFIFTHNGKKKLTAQGLDYLVKLREAQRKAKSKKATTSTATSAPAQAAPARS